MIYPSLTVRKSVLANVWVRSDGMISYPYQNGPWVPGCKICVNRKKVLANKHTPKYYFRHIYCGDNEWARSYFVHRLIALAFCENPCIEHFHHVDHINGDSLDNRSCNLRWCSRVLNSANRRSKNAYFDQQIKKWHSKVIFNKKIYYLGYYDTMEEAHKVSQAFKAKKFEELYLSYCKNETDTTRACCHIHGRVEPVTTVPETNDPWVLWPRIYRQKQLGLHHKFSTPHQTPL